MISEKFSFATGNFYISKSENFFISSLNQWLAWKSIIPGRLDFYWNINMIIKRSALDALCIEKIAHGELLAVVVKEFIEPQQAIHLTGNILAHGYEGYMNAPSIGRIGMAFYEAENDPDKVSVYFEQSMQGIRSLRERCSPLPCPIDILRCTLDETWPAGAMLETLYGKKMYVGLSRVVEPGVTFLAHHDIFSKDAPESFRAHSLQAQIACNIYLSMPEEGGDIHMWTDEISAGTFDAMRNSEYGIAPELLGSPDLVIAPEPGDLILFNSRMMHSVAPGKGMPRLSLSCFVGYRGPATPLSFWS